MKIHHENPIEYSFEPDAFAYVADLFESYDIICQENELDDTYIR